MAKTRAQHIRETAFESLDEIAFGAGECSGTNGFGHQLDLAIAESPSGGVLVVGQDYWGNGGCKCRGGFHEFNPEGLISVEIPMLSCICFCPPGIGTAS